MSFALLAALAVVQGTPAPAPTPINQQSWITPDDYPAPALRSAQEGRVIYRLDVDASGTVTDCTIVTSSGSGVLDVHTCDLLRLRARFEPAHDQMNHAIPSRYSGGMGWVIPDGRPWDVSGIEPVQGQTIDLVVGSDGRVKQCTVVGFVGSTPGPDAVSPCAEYPNRSRYTDPTVRNGRPVEGRIRITETRSRVYD